MTATLITGLILQKNDDTDLKFAPIFDCGSCLYPQMADAAIPFVLSSPKEIEMRIDKFPTAALELPDKTKANYKEYINSLQNPDCTAALLRVYPQIDLKTIFKIINDNPSISDVRKNFYSVMIQKRIERILEPAYEKVCSHSFSNGISNKPLENSKAAEKKPKFDMTDD